MDLKSFKWIIPLVLITVGIAARWLPHAPNFTPLLAIALYAGAHIKKTWAAFLIPMVVLFISDLVLNAFYPEIYFVYGSFALTVFFGRQMGSSLLAKSFAAISSALSFFLITNAAAWYYSPTYAKSLAGLWQSYVAGLPFFRNTLTSTLLFTALFFVTHHYLSEKQLKTVLN